MLIKELLRSLNQLLKSTRDCLTGVVGEHSVEMSVLPHQGIVLDAFGLPSVNASQTNIFILFSWFALIPSGFIWFCAGLHSKRRPLAIPN